MQEFIVRGSKPLDLCLRMLFSNDAPFHVKPFQDEKERVYYRIIVNMSEQKFKELIELYRTLIH